MNRPLIAAAAGAVVVGLAMGLNYLPGEEEAEVTPPVEKAENVRQAAEAAAEAAAKAVKNNSDASAATATRVEPATPQAGDAALKETVTEPIQPSFDVVRINPKGDTVVAGRAAPGSTVDILDGETVIGTVTADHRGEWVFVPDTPLPPGERQLSLRARDIGESIVASEEVVVLVVPERGKDVAGEPSKKPEQALALQVPKAGGASKVLQKPRPDPAQIDLKVDTVDYDDVGAMAISGVAPAGAVIQLYLDNRFIGRTRPDDDGSWSVSPDARVEPGLYTLRIDQVDFGGNVRKRISIPFARAEPPKDIQPGRMIVVQPGNSLWRLARNVYGSGFAFTVIYGANKEQIKDPDLIFPGQVFTLPPTN